MMTLVKFNEVKNKGLTRPGLRINVAKKEEARTASRQIEIK
jgi:hypothetical protein